jgi:hypothetical protein
VFLSAFCGVYALPKFKFYCVGGFTAANDSRYVAPTIPSLTSLPIIPSLTHYRDNQ